MKTAENEIELLQLQERAVNTYSPKVYSLLKKSKELLLNIQEDQILCAFPVLAMDALDEIIGNLEAKISRKESFEAVMRQVSFE